MGISARILAGVVGGALATVFFFCVWWVLLYVVSSIIVAANVPIQMSGEESVNLVLALALVSGAISTVAIFVATARTVGRAT